MIETLISSKTRIKLLIKFFLNSDNTAYLRNLEEEFGESTNGIRLELNKFEKAGFLNSFTEGNKKIFKANTEHPLYNDLNRIIRKIVGVEYIVDYIVQRAGDLQKVYLIGTLANGQDSSVVEIILVGNNLNEQFLKEQVAKAEKRIKKTITYTIVPTEEFDYNLISNRRSNPLLLWAK